MNTEILPLQPIYIVASRFNQDCDSHNLEKEYADLLPRTLRNKYHSYKNARDRQLFLLGRQLVIFGAKAIGRYELKLGDIKDDQFGKPFFPIYSQFYFNISHSGNFVICGVSGHLTMGLDIEEMKPISYLDMADFFHKREIEEISMSADPERTFYRLWTRKEAVMKADGRGMHIPLKSIELFEEFAIVEDKKWFLHELNIWNGYMCHLATNIKLQSSPRIQMVNII